MDRKWLKKQAAKVREADFIDPALYRKYGVKRGLRNENGSGVLVGLTSIGSVHGYVMNEGERQAIPGELYYRGINVNDIVEADRREHRFGYEETAYLLLFGELPTARELIEWKNLIGDKRRLSDGFKESAILHNPPLDLMNALARAVLFAYAFDEGDPDELSIEKCLEQSVSLIGSIPTIAAYAYQAKNHYHNGASLLLRNPDTIILIYYPAFVWESGRSSMAELQPSKLATRVRFPSPAPDWAKPGWRNGSRGRLKICYT